MVRGRERRAQVYTLMDQVVGTLYNEWMLTFFENLSQFEENWTGRPAIDGECQYCSPTCRQSSDLSVEM